MSGFKIFTARAVQALEVAQERLAAQPNAAALVAVQVQAAGVWAQLAESARLAEESERF